MEENDNIVQTNACTIKGEGITIRRWTVQTTSHPLCLFDLNPPTYNMEGFMAKEIQQCSSHKIGPCALANGTCHKFRTIKPPRWQEYVDQTYGRDQPRS